MRHLLTRGNSKLGDSIHVWSLPAITTCPGRTSICEQACYATKGRFNFPVVKERLQWNLDQANREDFSQRMQDEIKSRGIMVVRIHSSGDFFSHAYAKQWELVVRNCINTRFYFYTRSWRAPEIAPILERMAKLSNCTGWNSTDVMTGTPEGKTAYLQTSVDDLPEDANLVFRVRKLRKLDALPVVCPAETRKGGSCGGCQRCF